MADGGPPSLQQITYAEKLTKYCVDPEFVTREIWWFYGSTGKGKTNAAWKTAMDMGFTPATIYIHPGGRFLDGYDQQKCAIFDDIRDNGLEFNVLLRITDRYPVRVEVKTSSCAFNCKYLIFTAPQPPDIIFRGRGEDMQQIVRRIQHLVNLDENCPEVQKVIL